MNLSGEQDATLQDVGQVRPMRFTIFMRMHRRSFILALLLGLAPLTMASPTESAAAELIQRQNVGRNLKVLAIATAQRTQTFAMMASKLGRPEAQRQVSKELDAYAAQFQGQWNANLAKIYARHVTQDELKSLTSEGRSSRFISKLVAKQKVIGTEMQQQSSPILVAYVSAAMNSAFTKFSSN